MQANKQVNSQRCKQPQDQANTPNQPIEQTNICSEPLSKKPTDCACTRLPETQHRNPSTKKPKTARSNQRHHQPDNNLKQASLSNGDHHKKKKCCTNEATQCKQASHAAAPVHDQTHMPHANTWPNNRMSAHATKQPTNQPTKRANIWSSTSVQEASEQTFN